MIHPPWPHQTRLTNLTLEAIQRGERRCVVQAPTGAGKTRVMEMLATDYLGRGKKVICYTNRVSLVEQLSASMTEAGLYHGVRASGYDDEREHNFQISSIQTEHSRVTKRKTWNLHEADLVLVDECFVGETEILTPRGSIRIDNVRPGDTVYCASGIGVVESVSCRSASDLYLLEFSDGSHLACTENHRIFTGAGWIKASAMVDGALTCGPKTLSYLWENISASQMANSRRKRACHRGTDLEQAAHLLAVLLEEATEPYEQKPGSSKDAGNVATNTSSSFEAWRERAITSLAPACDLARSWGRMGVGSVGPNSPQSMGWERVSDVLQDRRSKSYSQDRNRIGRARTRHKSEKGARRQEDGLTGQARLVNVSRLKPESSRTVFNLRVYGHPSYFANGHLVHNCHIQTGERAVELFNAHIEQGANIVGATATPLGLKDIYDHLITGVTMQELRECGALVPAIHYAADEPDLKAWKKLRKNMSTAEGQDPTARQQGEMMMTPTIFGRVWEWFERLNQGRPTILFGPSVDGSIWFAEQFTKKGIKAAHIDGDDIWYGGKWYKSDPGARKDMKEAHKDGRLKIVTNRYVMREGVDWPWISHIILAFVAGSLQTYLQTCGRGLRAYPNKPNCIIQGHGGEWWRHGSVNSDRHWRLEDTDQISYNQRADGVREGKIDRPFRCPKCGRVWAMGRECKPAWGGCGFELPPGIKVSRPVIGTDGELREMVGEPLQPHRVSTNPKGPDIWKRMYYRSITEKGSRSFRAAMALFAMENNWQYPDKKWPMMPTNPYDVDRLVADVPREYLVPEPSRVR